MKMFKGTLSILACCAFALSMGSCVPTASPATPSKEWIQPALAPTDPELNKACERGYAAGEKDKKNIPSGSVKREIKNGFLYFSTPASETYARCYLFGVSINALKPKDAPKLPGNITIKDSPSDVRDTRVSLEFRSSTGEVIDTVPNLSGEVATWDKARQVFSLPQWTNLQIINMKQSSSLAVLIVQGQTQQRHEFRREDFGGLL
jgi:hypothetical protein